MREIKVRLGSNSYQVYIGCEILSRLGAWLKQSQATDKLAIVTHPSIKRLYGEALQPGLTQEGFEEAWR